MFYLLYKTTNLINDKTYIGIHKTMNINDGYLGSGLAIKRAIKKYGKENFNREILEQCSSYEELIEREKILVNNNWIGAKNNYNLKTGGNNTGVLSDKSKNKISETLKRKYASGEIIHPFEGKKREGFTPFNKGKTIDELFSEDKVIKIKKSLSESSQGRQVWNKGKKGVQVPWNKGLETGPMSDEQKSTISESLKEIYQMNGHHLKGKPSPRKGKAGVPSAMKGKKQTQQECPYCNKLVDSGNGKRWHFNNCKLK